MEAEFPPIRADVADIKQVVTELRDDLIVRRAQPSQPSVRLNEDAGAWWKKAILAMITGGFYFLAVCVAIANQAPLSILKIPGGP